VTTASDDEFMNTGKTSDGNAVASPQIEMGALGEVEVVPLTRIQKFAAGVLARNWATIPHVTHHDEADITELEIVRTNFPGQQSQPKMSLLAFLIKAVVGALRAHPTLNASLDAKGINLMLKKYFNIGIAIDTPSGLLVGVIRDCHRKPIGEIGRELATIARKARERGLTLEDISGGSFTISSLGSIGGTGFTPIINAPEVAILGVAKAQWKPMRGADNGVDWRLMLPLSLSYDHRVVNGADAARFVRSLADALAQPVTLV
jgi:pyruvate dehydrogenase E2 component (dihydrolipoamide acetyltransferase)